MKTNILIVNLENKNGVYKKNIYAIRIKDGERTIYEIIDKHDGYCPPLCNDRDHSLFLEYLCNLEQDVVKNYFTKQNLKIPRSYHNILEVMTDKNGEIYRVTKLAN